MTHGTSTSQAQPSPAAQPDTVAYFWIAAIEKPNGHKLNCHAIATVTPGVHTRADVYRDVLAFLEQKHGEFVCLSFSLEPNALGSGDPISDQRTAPTDGTPTNDRDAALHWAAVAIGLARAREKQGRYLTTDEQAAFSRYQAAARSHGFTDEQIHCHADELDARAAAVLASK